MRSRSRFELEEKFRSMKKRRVLTRCLLQACGENYKGVVIRIDDAFIPWLVWKK